MSGFNMLCLKLFSYMFFFVFFQGVKVDVHAGKLLGLAGLTPQQPATYIQAWRNRRDYTRELRIKEEILREREESASPGETQT